MTWITESGIGPRDPKKPGLFVRVPGQTVGEELVGSRLYLRDRQHIKALQLH